MPISNHFLSQIYVLDQDAALDFYVGTLGLEVSVDQDLGFMRWLTVRVPGDTSGEILLELPGPPSMDPATGEQLRELVTKGAAGWLGFQSDDVHALHEELVAKGVDITQEPTTRDYGTDIGLRDPFGNAIRVNQLPG